MIDAEISAETQKELTISQHMSGIGKKGGKSAWEKMTKEQQYEKIRKMVAGQKRMQGTLSE